MSPDRIANKLINQRYKRDSTIKYMTTTQIPEVNIVNPGVSATSVPSLVKRCICVSQCYYILCYNIICQNIISKSFSLYIFVFVVVRKDYLL